MSSPTYRFLVDKPECPWPTLAEDRARCPVAHHEDLGIYQLTAYRHLEEVIRDWRRFSSVGTINNKVEEILAFVDPPKHTRQRRLFSKALSGSAMAQNRPFIQSVADELLDGLSGRDSFDVVEELANPLVLRVVCHLLGVPHTDIPRFREWTKVAERLSYAPQKDDIDQIRSFRVYSRQLIAERTADPDPPDDLLTAMVGAEWTDEDGNVDRLSGDEVCNILEFLLVAANSTTTDAIGNLFWALETHPDEKAKLLADPAGLIGSAVEEILRFDGPIHALQRTVTTDTEVGGVALPAGATLVNVYAGAGRDPEAYDDPDEFKVDRDWSTLPHHFGFGWGTHFCLGAHLAREEIAIAITTLYERVEGLRVPEGFTPEQVEAPFLRGWQELPVQLDRILPAPSRQEA